MYKIFVVCGVALFMVGVICALDSISSMRTMIFAFNNWREEIYKTIKFFINKNIIKGTRKNIVIYPLAIVFIIALLLLIGWLIGYMNRNGLYINRGGNYVR